ncbi:acetyl-coenzyme A transporter 1-like [Metopolophium dirhodum]|uniref:acetyl-coenzyme A transporter 1-like n=1 Tax=Metopolophium dirhodum TaxID=44670 RepID=UPI00299014AE|nr:acetyl-coenzyme A transporter 1-like [Metopolophium dirhodum]
MKNLQKNDNASEELDVTLHSTSTKPNLKGDRSSLFLLIILYIMQGITFGFSILALPIILQSKKVVTYGEQALFSYVLWPYSLKLCWAPLVDVHYVQWIGKRKSWLLPVQYLMGVVLLYAANNINDWIPETGKPNIVMLTCLFFVLNLLASTQNIVVDSWALTMLKKANLGYSSVCSSSGFAIGIMLGSVFPVLFTSEDFYNKYLRNTPSMGGIMTLESLLFICGILFILVATLIGIFKKEKDTRLEDNYEQLHITNSYKLLWDILKLPNIRALLIALLTMKVGFSAMRNSLLYLKLVDAGVPKDDIMVLTTAMFAVKIVTPIAVSKYTSGPKPMSVCLKSMPIKLIWSLTHIGFIYFTPMIIYSNGILNIPIYYYLILGFLNAISEALSYIMLVATTAFFSRISDSRFGGTYMSLLNTVTNFGMTYSTSIGLKCMDFLTFKKCSNDSKNNCSTMNLKKVCDENYGNCLTTVDGYYVEIIICVVIGFIWYGLFRNMLKNFQTKSSSYWMVYVNQQSEEKVDVSVDPCSK